VFPILFADSLSEKVSQFLNYCPNAVVLGDVKIVKKCLFTNTRNTDVFL